MRSVLGLLTTAVAVVCASCQRPERTDIGRKANKERSAAKVTAKSETSRERQATEHVLATLATRHNAIRGWVDFGRNRGDFPQVFTLEFQDAVKRLNGKPAVSVCRVADVYQLDGRFRLLCNYEPPSLEISLADALPKVLFRLDIDEAAARRVIQTTNEHPNPKYFAHYFGLVILPATVRVGHHREVTAQGEYIESGEGPDHEERETRVEISSGDIRPVLEITGRCLEILYLENYAPE